MESVHVVKIEAQLTEKVKLNDPRRCESCTTNSQPVTSGHQLSHPATYNLNFKYCGQNCLMEQK